MTKPLLVIHRMTPVVQNDVTLHFTQYEYTPDGTFTEEVMQFTVAPESSYHNLLFSQVVLAEKTDVGSRDIRIYDIADLEGAPSVVHKIPLTERVQVFTKIVEDYLKESKNGTH